ICPQNPHTRPCIHQSQATIPPPSRLHTPRHYSVSAQVSAIPLRRRVVVELWWYEGALAPVDPQHRTGTRRDTGCVQRMVARAGTPSGTGGRVIPARGYLCSCGHELPRLSELLYLCEIRPDRRRPGLRLGTKKPPQPTWLRGPVSDFRGLPRAVVRCAVLVLAVVVSVQPGDAVGAPPSRASGYVPSPPLLGRSVCGVCGQAVVPIPGGLAVVAVVVDEDAGTSGCVVPDAVTDGGLKHRGLLG